MEKAVQRLNNLFLNDESLLNEDTGLRIPVQMTIAKSPENAQAAVNGERPLLDEDRSEKITSVISNAQILASKDDDKSQNERSHGRENEVQEMGQKPDERLAFESGIEPPLSLIAQSFCPAAAIMKLPYKYMHSKTSIAIGKRFFDKGRFWMRKWDLYYIFPPEDLAPHPMLLLSALQVQTFLDLIGEYYNISLTIPMNPEMGLLLPFEESSMPQPQYIGQSSDRDAKDDLVAMIPQTFEDLSDDQHWIYDNMTAETSAAFHQKMKVGLNAVKKKSTFSREQKRNEKIQKQRIWVRSLKRAQCYLGLHPHRSYLVPEHASSVEEPIGHTHLKDQVTAFLVLPSLYLKTIAPLPFVYEPIFICVDVEWNERQRNQITEVGISTLDTLDIANLAPGEGGKNWIQWIRSRHIRINEHAHVVNQDFVSGCPDRFEFGRSEFVPLRNAARVVESCFNSPYSAQIPVKFMAEEPARDESKVIIDRTIQEYKLRSRNMILVGHGLQGDIEYLRNLGFNFSFGDSDLYASREVQQHPERNQADQSMELHFLDVMDTATMFQALKRDVHTRGLEGVLNSLGIPHRNLHNAGNDARYTLEAMVHIAVNARIALDNEPPKLPGAYIDWALRPVGARQDGGVETNTNETSTPYEVAWKAEIERRVSEISAEREMQIRDDCKIWEIVTGWDSQHPLTDDDIDGGEPMGIKPARADRISNNNRQTEKPKA